MSNLTPEQVVALVNDAVNDIDDEIEFPDEGSRDVANLIVNVVAHRINHPEATVDDCIIACYDAEPEVVKGWCQA